MNLKVLFMIIMYYTIISLFFSLGGSLFSAETGYSHDNPLNTSEIQEQEIEQGGLFATGISFTRFIGLVTIGVGLPEDTPLWFQLFFSAWQILLLILTVGFFIDSIWSG